MNKIEDEFHVVMECKFYEELRELLYNNLKKFTLFAQLPDQDARFLFLMSTNNGDCEISKLVINYVSEIWAKRKGTFNS